MSREGGYTLVEMLAALAVIGLAFGGLTAGSHILLRQQRSTTSDVATSDALATTQASFEKALGNVKSGDVLFADARRIEFACETDGHCGSGDLTGDDIVSSARVGADRVAVVAARGYRFLFWTATGQTPLWSSESKDGLAGVTLTTDKARATPIAVVRLREAQAFRCEYDVVIASCRDTAP